MDIIKADNKQFDSVRYFYHSLIDGMANSPYGIGWKKDVYPSPEYLRESISNGELYVGIEDEKIIAAMILNHQCNDGYKSFNWHTKAEADEITVIHALGVHPMYSGKGYAKMMVKEALQIATDNKQKAVRLDVLGGNLPATRLYAGIGFKYMDTLKMYYVDTGWTDYELYEYAL